MQRLDAVLSAAAARLTDRQQYARSVIWGSQRWSGSDLKGTAKKYGAGYARQRNAAKSALFAAGGLLVAVKPGGLLVSAVYLGQDDYGTALYDTTEGPRLASDLR